MARSRRASSTRRWASATDLPPLGLSRSGVPVHGVGGPAGEAERRVHPYRRRVVLVHVEHDVGEPAVPQVGEARRGSARGRGRRPAGQGRPPPRRPRRSGRRPSPPSGCTLVQWNPTSLPSRSARKKPSGSNHGSASRSSRSSVVHEPCSGWWANARRLTASQASSSAPGRKVRMVTPGGSAGASSGMPDIGLRICQSARTLVHPRRTGERRRGGQVAVRPHPDARARRPGRPGGRAASAVALPPVTRVDDELAAQVAVRRPLVGRVQVGVPGHCPVSRAQHELLRPPAVIRARGVLERLLPGDGPHLQQHVLGKRRHAVGGGGGFGERPNLVGRAWGERVPGRSSDRRQGPGSRASCVTGPPGSRRPAGSGRRRPGPRAGPSPARTGSRRSARCR